MRPESRKEKIRHSEIGKEERGKRMDDVETKPCPKCSKMMALVFTGISLDCIPPIRPRKWKCECGHKEDGPEYQEDDSSGWFSD
jgi:hypothetical protein